MTVLVAAIKELRWPKFDGVWSAIFFIILAVGLLDYQNLVPTVENALRALLAAGPYILFAILAIAFGKATGAETLIAHAFEGRESQSIILAALIGGLSPFCSCQVIPFIAGLLALGTPISAVMAFWLSSPLIDPSSLLITAAALGWTFAVGKTVSAVAIGAIGGFTVMLAAQFDWFKSPLKQQEQNDRSCCGPSPFKGRVHWSFWNEASRRELFRREALANGYFLIKWLTFAYLLESLMISYVPAETIASVIGGSGIWPITLSAIIGVPAYLNSYAAPPLVAGLMEQGMSAGAAMSFMIAGAISCIPAMTAVFALVRRQVFVAYIVLGFTGAVLSGLIFDILV